MANNNTQQSNKPAKTGLWQTTKGVAINSLGSIDSAFTAMNSTTAALALYASQLELDAMSDLMESSGCTTAEELQTKLTDARAFLAAVKTR